MASNTTATDETASGVAPPTTAHATIVLGLVALAGVIASTAAACLGGVESLMAASAATAVCLAANAMALSCGWIFSRRDLIVYRVLGTLFVRSAAPLAACLWVHSLEGPLATGGFVYYLLGLYLLSVLVDTALIARNGLAAAPKATRG